MPNASISGLASGLDTATIISQLMQLEAIPQSRLRTQVRSQESVVSKLQDLNAKLAALATRATDLAKASAWSPLTATSSYDQVTVTTTDGATATSLSFTVDQTAKAHQLTSVSTAALTDVVVSGGTTVRLDRLDGTTVDIDTGDGTLQGLVAAVNNAGEGVRASTIKLDDGSYRLRLESAATGAASDFTLTNADGSALLGGSTVVAAGRDARITVGGDQIGSATNTFADLLPGVGLTLAPGAVAGTAVDIDLAADSTSMVESVKGLVDALNAILGDIDTATKNGGTGTTAGVLAGDSTMRSLRDQLVATVYSAAGAGLSEVGVELDRYGKLTLDEAKLTAAYEADPAATSAHFVKAATDTGFADRLATVADLASDSIDGTVTMAIKGRKAAIDRLNDSIDAWDVRLELRRTTLTRQFTALETALSRMQSQSSWLAGQIASLPTASS